MRTVCRWPPVVRDALMKANLVDIEEQFRIAAYVRELMAHKGQRGDQGSVHADKKTDMAVVKAVCGGKRGK